MGESESLSWMGQVFWVKRCGFLEFRQFSGQQAVIRPPLAIPLQQPPWPLGASDITICNFWASFKNLFFSIKIFTILFYHPLWCISNNYRHINLLINKYAKHPWEVWNSYTLDCFGISKRFIGNSLNNVTYTTKILQLDNSLEL